MKVARFVPILSLATASITLAACSSGPSKQELQTLSAERGDSQIGRASCRERV